MSAIRREGRSAKRNAGSLPYRKPGPPKATSSWSLKGLFSYIVPSFVKSKSQEVEEDEIPSAASLDSDSEHASFEDVAPQTPMNPAQSLSSRGHALAREIPPTTISPSFAAPFQSPPASSNPFSFSSTSSPQKNLQAVTQYLEERQKSNVPLSEAETAGLVHLIKESTPAAEVFSFSRSRSSTPVESSPNRPTTPSARKTLASNPNGSYRWEGGGSAKRQRNRYQSSAFGSSRTRHDRPIILETPNKGSGVSKSDSKRRRVGEDISMSAPDAAGPQTPPRRAAAPEPSPTRVVLAPHQATPSQPPSQNEPTEPTSPTKSNGAPATPRLRVPAKPTTPARPSPLRQTWNGGSPPTTPPTPPSQSSSTSALTSVRQTKTANFMSELIKEVTPPKKPDVSNPYQAASPVKLPLTITKSRGKKVQRPSKSVASKEQSEPVETPKTKEPTAQEIIEATMPKGSKRARPPAHMSVRSNSEQSTQPTITVEEVSDEDDASNGPSPKKKSKSNGNGNGYSLNGDKSEDKDEMEIVELDEATAKEMASSKPPTSSTFAPSLSGPRPVFGGAKISVPKEPSKLRYSVQPESSSSSSPASSPPVDAAPIFGLPPSSSANPFGSFSSAFGKPAAPPPPQVETPPKPDMAKGSSSAAPDVVKPTVMPYDSSAASLNLPSSPTEAAKVVYASSLPTYDFTVALTTVPSVHEQFANAVKAAPITSLPTFDFDAAKPAPAPPASVPVPQAQTSFNWAAAGIKPPQASANDGSWECSSCNLKNPASATTECQICEAKRPGVAAAAAPAMAFDWAKAGMKPPTSTGWKCSVCACDNPASATEQCTVCESPK